MTDEAARKAPPPPDSLRLSQATRDQITTLKRRTSIQHMNVICRWALCRSLAEPTTPVVASQETALEIAWRVLAGEGGDVWWALVLHRCHDDGLIPSPEEAAALFRAHVARGISYLVGDPETRDPASFARLALGDD